MSASLPSPPRVEKDNTNNNNNAPLYQLPGLPPSLSESLAAGTSIPPPLPSPPLFEKKIPSMTPERAKPNTQYKFLPSPPLTRGMPGAFPASRSPSPTTASPQTPRKYNRGSNSYMASAYASEPLPRSPNYTPHSKSPRRSSGLRNLLFFRRSSQLSPESDAFRGEPLRPNTTSTTSTFGLSLGRTPGGSFWRRKSGMRMPADERSPHEFASPVPNGYDSDGNGPDARRTVSYLGRNSMTMDTMTTNRRNTGQFWRRKSSGTLNVDGLYARFAPEANGNGAVGGEGTPVWSPVNMTGFKTRPESPPPKLPELSAVNGHLDADDMFKNIR